MKINCAWGVLLLAFNTSARDPFFLPGGQRCAPAAELAFTWRLLGVIGRESHYAAWLAPPQGKALRRHSGDSLPDTAWYITGIDAQAVTLTMRQDCAPTRRLELKGRHNAQDDVPLAGADQPVISQPGAPDTGI